jgi:hypothetical protein
MIYGLKDVFIGKHQQPQPVYNVSPPQNHYYHQPAYIPYGSNYGSNYGSSSYGGSQSHASSYANSREDGLPSINSAQSYNSPQFNRPINQLPSFNQPQQNFQPQAKFGQPQMGSFNGIALEAPQQIQYSPHLFNQPYTRLHNVETLDQRILSENSIDDHSQLIQAPQPSLTPQELTKVLSDAIAQVSSRSTPSPMLIAIHKR